MKTVVIYKSKTGSAKKFAELISNELGADIFDISKVTTTNMLEAYDTVITVEVCMLAVSMGRHI